MFRSIRTRSSQLNWIGISILIFFIFLFSIKIVPSISYQDGEFLFSSLEDAGVNIQNVTLQHSAMVRYSQSKDEVLRIKQKVEQTFDFKMAIVSDKNEKDLIKYQGQRNLSPNTKLQVAWIGKKEPGKTSKSLYFTHIVAEISSNRPEEWKTYYDLLTAKLKELEIEPQINTSFQGKVNRVMTTNEQSTFIRNVFRNLEGKVTEGITLDSVVSLSGYSKKLSRSVISSSGKINMQVAAHVNPLDKTTVITIGNPVIDMEY